MTSEKLNRPYETYEHTIRLHKSETMTQTDLPTTDKKTKRQKEQENYSIQ